MRYYSTTAGEMTLQAAITATAGALTVDTTAGLPLSYPYTLIVDYGQANEEVVDVTAAAGTSLTITRGVDGTTGQAHGIGAKIRHGVTGRDHRESRDHEAATSAVHGVTGAVVGTTDVQTLDNKTFTPAADHPAIVVRARADNTTQTLIVEDPAGVDVADVDEGGLTGYNSAGETLWQALWAAAAGTFQQIFSLQLRGSYVGVVGNVVAGFTGKFLRLISGATELFSVDYTGKVTAASAQVTGTTTTGGLAATTATVAGAPVVTTTGAQTLTNKTLGAPKLSGVVSGDGTESISIAGTITTTGNVSANEVVANNLGSGARWDFAVTGPFTGTTDASGFATITHGAGFLPYSVIAYNNAPGSYFSTVMGVDSLTTTTVRVRFFNPSNGTIAANLAYSVKLESKVGVAVV